MINGHASQVFLEEVAAYNEQHEEMDRIDLEGLQSRQFTRKYGSTQVSAPSAAAAPSAAPAASPLVAAAPSAALAAGPSAIAAPVAAAPSMGTAAGPAAAAAALVPQQRQGGREMASRMAAPLQQHRRQQQRAGATLRAAQLNAAAQPDVDGIEDIEAVEEEARAADGNQADYVKRSRKKLAFLSRPKVIEDIEPLANTVAIYLGRDGRPSYAFG